VLFQSITAGIPDYCRYRPERSALFNIVAEHYPRFIQEVEQSGGYLPKFVRREFEDFLKCGLLEHSFLRVKCDGCQHEHLVALKAISRNRLRDCLEEIPRQS